MNADKEVKTDFKIKASKDPDKYYATSVLKKEGFTRKRCNKCGTYFWSVTHENACGNPACSGGFRFIGNTPAKKELDYIGVWKEFSSLFKKWGYTPIKRYPVVARWREDTDFVQASIYDFQPYVVSGEVEPPANPLVVPQMCLRFNDIDNIGITGAHYCAFVMIGQHAFMKPKDWNQEKYFTDIHNWLKQGLGLPNDEIKFHEDAWAGGGNFGPCMEYFSRGLELGNQVYMMYEQTPGGSRELNLKVLDMGMGHERNAWFTQGKSTSYETTFPTVVRKLYEVTGVETDKHLMQKFLPYSSYLNVDEVENIDSVWNDVANKIGYDVDELRKKIQELAALYSVAEHSRALLVALSDGALPSNVGGGYNLRVILRRALSFIDKHKWDIYLPDLCRQHANYLEPLFPELMQNLDEVEKILDVEKSKYEATKQKTNSMISKLIKEDIDEKKLLVLYDSYGITPELVSEEAQKFDKKINVPENFYARVAELHENREQEHATEKEEKLNLEGVPDTKALYYADYKKNRFKAKVLKIIENKVILDETYFYPTSGGQLHDLGTLNNQNVIDVFRQGKVIIHVLNQKPEFSEGVEIEGEIDLQRRLQLAKHHTATHLINAAARKVLGSHINQAGAKKDIDKATIDLTHYENITDEQLNEIEKEANRLVKENIEVESRFLPRTEAEQAYGMGIYQGGAVPGKTLRIVNIKGIDVEACGGTHLHNTSEAGEIKILKATKISDGIVRLYFTAGEAAQKEKKQEKEILEEAARLLGVKIENLPSAVNNLFEEWKFYKKLNEKLQKYPNKKDDLIAKAVAEKIDSTLKLEEFKGNVLDKVGETLKTQPEHVVKTIKRFLKELEEYRNKLK
ncbi:alanine--tRNA ligase [Candidatus Woesearchaeota archaeon]|nr:alanine--tRNA ligase [Candidatus Woesearchaeota archaeon]